MNRYRFCPDKSPTMGCSGAPVSSVLVRRTGDEAPDKAQVVPESLPARAHAAEILDHEPAVVADPVEGGEESVEVHDAVFERRPAGLPHAAALGPVEGSILQVDVRQVGA